MSNHVLCYVQRHRVTDWKRLVISHDMPAFIYGSNDERVFVNRLRDGGTLWVVSSIPDRAPELVARLAVVAILQRKDPKLAELGVNQRLVRHFAEFKWIAVGGPQSEFFGHNTAGNALLSTVFETTSGRPWALSKRATKWHARFGMRLQRPTAIHQAGFGSQVSGIAALEDLAETSERSIFISWKWRDNPRARVQSLAYALAENGFMPWLDQLALPMARALRKVQKNEHALEALLRYGYQRCAAVIGVETAQYATQSVGSSKNWTLREWNGELGHESPPARIVFHPEGAKRCSMMSQADLRLSSERPHPAAKELRRWFDRRNLVSG